ncbi:hypothetical protein NIES2101_37410 [Calothrix sp. HK-06]|nr:hypothetical protein NIES2101_37410 [Calothrix sp. HK-06]
MTIVDTAKNRLFIASFTLGLASSIAIFTPHNNDYFKNISRVFLGLSIGGLIAGEYITSVAVTQAKTSKDKHESLLKEKDLELSSFEKKVTSLQSKLKQLQDKSNTLDKALSEALSILNNRTVELERCKTTNSELSNKLKTIGRFNTQEAYNIVRSTYTTAFKKLDGHIEALKRNYPEIQNKYEQLHIEIDSFKNRYVRKLEEYQQIESFNELLDIGMDIQEKVINGCIELRVKAQTILIRYLDSLLENAVSLEEYESSIQALESHVGVTVENLKLEHQANVRAIAQEWVIANNSHVERYQTSFDDVLQTAKYASEKLQERDIQINDLLTRLQELELPFLLPGEAEQANVSNSIANYYLSMGYRLDCLDWLQTDTGYKLLFSTSRNGQRFISSDMLNDKELALPEKLKELSNALNTPKFERSERGGHWYVDIQKWYPVKNKPIEKDISKLWITADKFEKTVQNWTRVRITGGSESGKSPTAENLAVAILKHRPGAAKLFNPQHDSVKNYWTLPVVGISHQDSEKGIAELAKLVDARSNGQESREQFELWVFDEIDSTMSHTKGKKSVIGGNVNFIIKQASHQNLGALFIGQNANVSEYPGMDRSDWNSAINLHIGTNCYDAITNSNLFTTEQQAKLKVIADKLTEYCEAKNDELGLEKTDPNAYRFAFVIEPNKKPYFMELPEFGKYTYTEITQINSESILSSEDGSKQPASSQQAAIKVPNTDYTVAAKMAASGYIGVTCPKCNIGVLGNPKKSRGVNYYPCNHCGKTTSENILKGNK